MTNPTCPKCRLPFTDDALDVGRCPACGFPFDGPIVLGSTGNGGRGILLVLAAITLFCVGGVAGYSIRKKSELTPVVAQNTTPLTLPAKEPAVPAIAVAPYPREAKPKTNVPTQKVPAEVIAPKIETPRPPGVIIRFDPAANPEGKFDNPNDTVSLPDLTANAVVVLTGRVRVLRIGSVIDKARLNASGLQAEEVILVGDISSNADVKVNAPNGKVTIGGFISGKANLTVAAPGGEVLFNNFVRVSGSANIEISGRQVEIAGSITKRSTVNITLSPAGVLKLRMVDDNATVTYRRSTSEDPPLDVEEGIVRGNAKVVAEN